MQIVSTPLHSCCLLAWLASARLQKQRQSIGQPRKVADVQRQQLQVHRLGQVVAKAPVLFNSKGGP